MTPFFIYLYEKSIIILKIHFSLQPFVLTASNVYNEYIRRLYFVVRAEQLDQQNKTTLRPK